MGMSKILCKNGKLWEPVRCFKRKPLEKTINNKCFVKKGTHGFEKFITANIEQIFTDPDIWIFRSIASDEDIEYLKNLAKDNLTDALVLDDTTDEETVEDYRIAQR